MKYQIIGILILLLEFIVISWDGIKNKSNLRIRWTGVSKIAFALIGPIELVAIVYGHSMLGYDGKVPGVIMAIIGLVIVYAFLIDRNRPAGPTRHLNQISRNPMYLGLILVFLGIMFMFCIWIIVIWTVFTIVIIRIQIYDEEKKMKLAAPKAFKVYKKRVFRFFGIKRWWFILGACVVVVIGIFVSNAITNSKIDNIRSMSYKEMLDYYTKGTSEVVLTVGTIENGEMKYTVYGRNAKKLEHKAHTYEMASTSKILTAALVNKAISEGKMNLADEISAYIELSDRNFYPTIGELLTHTSGYKSFYFESPMIVNGLFDINVYRGIKADKIINRIRNKSLPMAQYDYKYSNYGYALLGAILEKVYHKQYKNLLNEYTESIGLKNTGINNTKDDLRRYTKWENNDSYLASNGIRTDIVDMLQYTNNMMNDPTYSSMYQTLRVIGGDDDINKSYNIYMDDIGMAWIKDNKNGFVWTGGSSDNYNIYIGFSPTTKNAVVIMSNMPSNYRMSTTIMGIKYLKKMTKVKE